MFPVEKELMTTNDYDAIIVGGGHNGLVSAAYFARSGRSHTGTRGAKPDGGRGRYQLAVRRTPGRQSVDLLVRRFGIATENHS